MSQFLLLPGIGFRLGELTNQVGKSPPTGQANSASAARARAKASEAESPLTDHDVASKPKGRPEVASAVAVNEISEQRAEGGETSANRRGSKREVHDAMRQHRGGGDRRRAQNVHSGRSPRGESGR